MIMSDMENVSAHFAQITAGLEDFDNPSNWPVAVIDYERYGLNEGAGREFLDDVERAATNALLPGTSLEDARFRPAIHKRVTNATKKVLNNFSNPVSVGSSLVVRGCGVVMLQSDEQPDEESSEQPDEQYELYLLERDQNLLGRLETATVKEYPWLPAGLLSGSVDIASLQDENGDLPYNDGSGLVLVLNDVVVCGQDALGTVIERSVEAVIPFSLSGLAVHEALRLP